MMTRIFCSLLTIFVLSACISSKNLNNVKDSTKGISPSTIRASKGSGDIALLPHQLRPIDYLLKNPSIKGLLVNHYMGTGKTYLGIGFAQSLKDKKVIVLAPKFLESNWTESIKNYGVYKSSRFTFVGYDEAPTVLNDLDLSDHIILADEIQNLIKHMRSPNREQNKMYSQLYMNLRNAHRILALSGTPVYDDESDLAYMINLVSGQDLMPFNREAFRLKYTSIQSARQFFRGYALESNMFTYIFPVFSTLALGAILPDWYGFALGPVFGILAPVAIKNWLSTENYKLRKLDVNKFEDILSTYVSYFKFDESDFKEFPKKNLKISKISYNRPQYSFFLRLVEGDLDVKNLQRLLRNQKVAMSDEFVALNSSQIHQDLYQAIGAGREIGNFEFASQNGVIEPPKFVSIFQEIKKYNQPTVIYSNYYQTGTLAFSNFLKRNNYGEKFAIIEPRLPAKRVGEIIDSYNRGETKVLLLHPDITEGISLKGTRHLHILEPIVNSSVLEQVVGRTRRFRSHSHLPKNEQLVNVQIWQSESSNWNPHVSDIKRANWFKRYRELSYMSLWGIGISQVDKNYHKKALNPEELAQVKLETLEKNLASMREALTRSSIEQYYR